MAQQNFYLARAARLIHYSICTVICTVYILHRRLWFTCCISDCMSPGAKISKLTNYFTKETTYKAFHPSYQMD